jgi:hypothetical protein
MAFRHCIYLLGFALVFAACKKDDNTPEIPPPTQTGQNVIWCKIDGELQSYSGKINAFRNQGVKATFPFGAQEVYIKGIDRTKNGSYNDIVILASTENMELNKPRKMVTASPGSRSYYENHGYYYALDNATITFTKFESTLIAGTFEMHCKNDSQNIHITEGWFDILIEQ